MSAICAAVRSAQAEKAFPPATGIHEDAKWLTGDLPGRIFDIYVVRREHDDLATQAFGSAGAAWCYYFSNECIVREEYVPRSMRPDLSPTQPWGYIATIQLPSIDSNGFQEGWQLHEMLGHGTHGSKHEDSDPCMHQPEDLPAYRRLALFQELASYYPHIRIRYWEPGLDINLDDTNVEPYSPQNPWTN